MDAEDSETHLITYLENILKCQIIPMNFMNLRNLVEDAPQNMKLYEYIEEKYPDAQFLDFLKKYPNIFTVNPNRTVILTQGNSFTLPYMSSSGQSNTTTYDEVDGPDKKEYISDSDSSESDDDSSNERRHLIQTGSIRRHSDEHHLNLTDSLSSSCSDSSVDVFSSEIVQTSDSATSSLSSSSS
ncbi:uncharacterized protein TNCT_523081 [Trichonephila clavata]|uniref:Uncharacterized protein n=1 Tax=Trichonephila clavata TaxID=2740835 RepID=A0A8X6JDE2_TRICU|nr:uncharacterized protein TNCT_523081 [Trichonephila clavata]